MKSKGKMLSAVGTIAIVYGAGRYVVENLIWPEYLAWIVGGVVLVLIGWAKSSMEEK